VRYAGMEQEENTNGKEPRRRENRVIIRFPVRLAIFSIAILGLAAFALRIIADAAPQVSASLY
jgi:hypothetical protein